MIEWQGKIPLSRDLSIAKTELCRFERKGFGRRTGKDPEAGNGLIPFKEQKAQTGGTRSPTTMVKSSYIISFKRLQPSSLL